MAKLTGGSISQNEHFLDQIISESWSRFSSLTANFGSNISWGANYKLQSDHKIFSAMPVRQAEILENISKAGVAWLLLIHVSVLVIVLSTFGILVLGVPLLSALGEAPSLISIVFSVAIIVIAVVALSARAFQQGLQPEREIERYQQYRSAVQSILEQFD